MLGQRRERWPNIEPALVKRFAPGYPWLPVVCRFGSAAEKIPVIFFQLDIDFSAAFFSKCSEMVGPYCHAGR